MTTSPTLRWILLETPPWGHHIRLPGHHLALHLQSRGQQVAYVSAPVSPWHFLSGSQRAYSARRWAEGPAPVPRGEGLITIVPRTLVPVHRQFPFDCEAARRFSARMTFPGLAATLGRAGFGAPDIVVMHNQQLPGLLDQLSPRLFVLRVEDDISGFPNMPRILVAKEPELMRRADLVTVTAHTLADKVRAHAAAEPLYLPNGVNTDLFRRDGAASLPRPVDLPPGPVAIYVGTIDSWFDEGLLDEVAGMLPQWSFALIGPPRHPLERLSRRPNVHLLGPRDQSLVPAYLHHADAGIIPFRRIPLIESVCPIKLFEYLAAGLPVVSTRWREMELLKSPARLASTAEEFSQALSDAPESASTAREEGPRWAADYRWENLFESFTEKVLELLLQGGRK